MNASSTRFALALPALLLVGSLGAGDKRAVEITKNPATVEEKLLDLEHPPEAIRTKIGKHKGFTTFAYSLTWNAQDNLKSKRTGGDTIDASFVITKMDATLDLKTTVYLPPDASKKLRDHEAGHRRIADRMYEKADLEARRLAQAKIGRTYTGKGVTVELARKAATKAAGDELLAEYLAAVEAEGQKVQDLYDKITSHGLDDGVDEEDAIKAAFEQRKKEKAGAPR